MEFGESISIVLLTNVMKSLRFLFSSYVYVIICSRSMFFATPICLEECGALRTAT
ncbi:hypothetical protein M673_07215 [Aureimonas sp. AU20]|nr:hypothetical protein M673_07215 [Aureimonas sp. AU20]